MESKSDAKSRDKPDWKGSNLYSSSVCISDYKQGWRFTSERWFRGSNMGIRSGVAIYGVPYHRWGSKSTPSNACGGITSCLIEAKKRNTIACLSFTKKLLLWHAQRVFYSFPHRFLFLLQMLCEERGLFLEIADVIRGLGLTILKGLMETRNDKIWARFAVEVMFRRNRYNNTFGCLLFVLMISTLLFILFISFKPWKKKQKIRHEMHPYSHWH